jgi:hypothetical protein
VESAISEIRSIRSRRASKWALIIFVPCVTFVAYAFYDWYQGIRLGQKAMTTTGVITRVETDNHEQCDYEYTVGNVTYNGGEIIAGTSCYSGERVPVSYDPDRPETSTLTSFGGTGTRPVPILFFSVMGILFYFGFRSFLIRQMENNDPPYG